MKDVTDGYKPEGDDIPKNSDKDGSSSRRRRRGGRRRDKDETHQPRNDWTWYASDENLLKQSASLGFDVAAGDTNVPMSYSDSIQQTISTVPGIMVLHYYPIAGFTDDASSPLNVAIKSQYNQLMTTISSVPPFEAVDYGKYVLAMDSVYQVYNYIQRLYGILKHFEFKNRYIPESLFVALGEDYQDWKTHAPQYLWELNYAANRINARPVIKDMSYMLRHAWLTANYFKDSDSQKAQMYIYQPEAFLQFVEATESSDTPPFLQFTKPAATGAIVDRVTMRTGADWLSYLNTLIDSVLYSSDFDQIATWVLKSKEPYFVLSETPDSYEVVPAYNAEVLNQIQNATVIGNNSAVFIEKNYRIEEKVDSSKAISYLFTPTNLVSDVPLNTSRYINFNSEFVKEPEPKDVMTATRLMIMTTSVKAPTEALSFIDTKASMFYQYSVEGGPIELLTKCTIWNNSYNPDGNVLSFRHVDIPPIWNTTFNNPDVVIPWTTFDYRPAIPAFNVGAAVNTLSLANATGFYGYVQEIDRYTIISPEDLKRMHLTALMTLFGVKATK